MHLKIKLLTGAFAVFLVTAIVQAAMHQHFSALMWLVNTLMVAIKLQLERIEELTDTVRSAQRLVNAMQVAHNDLVHQTQPQKQELAALQAWAVEAEKAVGVARTFWRGTR